HRVLPEPESVEMAARLPGAAEKENHLLAPLELRVARHPQRLAFEPAAELLDGERRVRASLERLEHLDPGPRQNPPAPLRPRDFRLADASAHHRIGSGRELRE